MIKGLDKDLFEAHIVIPNHGPAGLYRKALELHYTFYHLVHLGQVQTWFFYKKQH